MKPRRVEKPAAPPAACEGALVLDLRLQPVALDRGAEALLSELNGQRINPQSAACLPAEIRTALGAGLTGGTAPLELHLHVGQHEYSCRAFFLEPANSSLTQAVVALYLKREASVSDAVNRLAAAHHLTSREVNVLIGISTGLTSKEIAHRMGISPNTVNTFLRLITIKMGVTTRAGNRCQTTRHAGWLAH